jgi:hypothetical protein
VPASPENKPSPPIPIELTVAGWFLIVAALWEIVFNRLAAALGLYANVGAEGLRGWLADSGRLAMNSVGIMALLLLCVTLLRLSNNRAFARLPWRVVLMLSSPAYLPVIFVSIFRPVMPFLILLGYLVAALSAFLIAVLIAVKPVGWSRRRIFLALGLVQLLPAFELVTRFTALVDPAGSVGVLPRRAYLIAEVLIAVLPTYAFFALGFGRLRAFARRPHVLALIGALLVLAAGIAAVVHTGARDYLSLTSYRTLGITIAIPGLFGLVVYLTGLFFGALLVGSLVLPSRRWPPTVASRRVGLGLGCIWIAGLQPTHPYQFAVMLLGFVFLARGFFDPAEAPLPAAAAGRQSLLDRGSGAPAATPEGSR